MPIIGANITSITTDSGTAGDFITNDRTLTIGGDANITLVGSTLGIWIQGDAFATPTLVGTVDMTFLLGLAVPWSFDLTTSTEVDAQSLADGTYTIIVADTLLPLTAFDTQTVTVDATPSMAIATVTGLSADSGFAGDFVTNVAAQTVSGTFTGTLAAGETIQVSTDGATWIDAMAGAGTWTASVTLPSGSGTLSVRTIDVAANVAAGAGHSFTLDTTAPAAPAINVIGGPDSTVSTQPGDATITGTAEAGSSVAVKSGATTLGTATADGSGNWRLVLSGSNLATIGQGSGKTVTATASDLAGNTSTTTTSLAFTVDTATPAAFATVTGLSSDSGASGDFITNTAAQTVSGTFTGALGAGEKVQVSTDGTTWIDATAGSGTWTASVTLPPGSGTLSVQTIDAAGNVTAGTGHGFTLDAVAPVAVATVTALSADSGTAGDFITNLASQTVSGTFTGTLGAGETIQVSVDGTTWIDASAGAGTWSAAGVTLPSGSGALSVRTIDVAANVTAGTGHAFTLDASAPAAAAAVTALSADSGTAGDFVTNVAGQTVSGTFTGALGAGEKIQVSVDGATWIDATAGAGTWSAAVTLPSGVGTLSVRTIDAAANVTAGTGRVFTLDTSAPAAPTVNPIGGADGTVSGQAGDATVGGTAEAGSTITVKSGATTLGTATADGSGTWSLDLSPANVAAIGQGAGKTITATAADKAGNASSGATSAAFTVDTVAPTATAAVKGLSSDSGTSGDFITNVGTQTVSGTFAGTLDAGEKIQVSADGTTWVDATAGAGTWSAAGVTLSPGVGLLLVQTIDAAGNATLGTGQTYVLDTTAPGAVATVAALSADTGTPGDFVTAVASQTVSGTFTGTLAAGEKIQVSVDGTTWIGATAGAGTWSAAGVTLSPGSGTLSVRTIDAAANVTAGVNHAFTLTVTGPTAVATVTALSADSGVAGDFITNVAAQTVSGTFTGTLAAGDKIQVSVDGATWIDATAGAGTWSVAGVTLLAGSGTLSVRTIDVASNATAGVGHAYTLDASAPAAPVIGSVGGADSTVSGQPGDASVTGTAEAGSTITVKNGATTLGTATADGSGGWTYTLTPGDLTTIGQGTGKTVSATATDTAGNSSTSTNSAAFTIDTVVPPAIATVTALSADSGTPGDFITAIAAQTVSGTFTGTLGAGEKIQVSANGATWVDATAGAGTWSAAGVTLSPGTGLLSVRTIDGATNTTAGVGHAYTLDTGAPPAIATVTALSADTGTQGDFVTSVASQTVSGTFTGTLGAGEKIQVSTDGATWIDATAVAGTWSAAGVTLQPGSGTLSVRTIDTASNSAAGVGHAYTLDTVAPPAVATVTAISADTGTPGDFVTTVAAQTVSGTFTGTLGGAEKIQVSVDGATWIDATAGAGTWSAAGVTLALGSGTLSVRTIDTAANVTSGNGHAYTLTASGPAAVATVTALSADSGIAGDFITNVATQAVSGTFTGTLAAGDKIQVSVDGATWIDATAGAGTWSAAAVILLAGSGTLSVRTIDASSNTAAGIGHAYTLDALAPAAPAIGSVGGADGTVSGQPGDATVAGTAEAGSTITVKNGATTLGTTTTDGSGAWTYALTPGDLTTIGQGSGKTVSATATDTAGNSSISSTSAAFTIDTVVPPAIATVTAISSDTGTPGDFITSVASQTVSGTFTGTLGAGEKIQVSANGTTWVDATSGVGTWSATGVTLSPGSGTLSVRTIDTALNTAAGVGHAYTLDTVLPPVVATVMAISADTGTPGDFVTAVASQTVSGTFTGTLGAGEKIQVSLDGTTWIDATAGASTWSAAGVTLLPGSGTLSVRTIDSAANITAGNGHGYTLTVGGPAAVATVTALSADTGTAGDFVTNVAAQTVSGTFTGALAAGDKIQVSTNGTTWVDATAGAGTWSVAGITLPPGSGILSVRTIDMASNITDGVGHAYTLDTSAPAAPAIGSVGGPDGTVSGQPGDATVAGTAEAGSTITVKDGATTLGTTTTDGSGNWTYTLTPTDQSTIGQGTGKTVTATATDAAGNSSTSSTSPAFTIDTVAPPAVGTVTAISADTGTPGDFVTNVASQTVSGSFAGTLAAGEKFQVSADGTTWVDATAGAGTWSAAGVILSPGTGILLVRTIDAASNSTLGTGHAYTLDTVLPPAVATVTALSADTGTPGDFVTTVASQTVSGTFTGTLGIGEKIQVSANGTTWIDASAGAGTWTASGVILSPGAGTLSVRTIDAATNVTAGVGHSYTLDISGGLPLVSIGPTTINHAEGDSGVIPYIFAVTLDHAATSAETINWSVSGGSVSGADFAGGVLPSGTLTFAAGETSKNVIVNVQGDTLVETNESFLVNLSSPSSGVVIGTGTASGAIVNDDGTAGPQGVHNDAYIVLQNKSLTIGAGSGVLFNDEGTAPQSAVHRTGPENGTLDFNSDGSFKYTAVNGFAGIDSFTYEASANGSLDATTALVYVVPTLANGAATTLNLIALDREEQVAATYISFFGRGADAPGFEFWVNQFAVNETKMSQHDLFANIASSFAVSDEAKALYPFLDHPQGSTDAEIQGFLNSVYDNMFNRTPDAGGLAYWTNEIKQTLASGAFVGFVLIQIINGAQDTVAGHDITTLMGKVAVNLEYVQQQEQLGSQWTSADDGAEARALMHAVTDNPQTVLTGVVQAQHLVQADV